MTTEAINKELRRHGHKLLDAARDVLTAPVDIAEEVVEGYPREALVEACERHAPALLVVGNQGLGGFKELLLGSTSHWAANHAPCPVVIARTPPPPATLA
jgi:nucleotide-binding universal stress UspA family protein